MSHDRDCICESCTLGSDAPMKSPASPTHAAREGIISDISRCVLRDRNATHGNPEDNFKVIAELMSAYLRGRGLIPQGREIASEDVAVLSSLIKVGRLAGNLEHGDNWVDGAGYFVCGGAIAATRAKPAAG